MDYIIISVLTVSIKRLITSANREKEAGELLFLQEIEKVTGNLQT